MNSFAFQDARVASSWFRAEIDGRFLFLRLLKFLIKSTVDVEATGNRSFLFLSFLTSCLVLLCIFWTDRWLARYRFCVVSKRFNMWDVALVFLGHNDDRCFVRFGTPFSRVSVTHKHQLSTTTSKFDKENDSKGVGFILLPILLNSALQRL